MDLYRYDLVSTSSMVLKVTILLQGGLSVVLKASSQNHIAICVL